jgi:hypothetical protein
LTYLSFPGISWIDHNNIYRDRLRPGTAGSPRIPGVDTVHIAENSVIQLLSPNVVRSFHLAVEPNRCSLEIGPASGWTRANKKLLAVFSDKETELFFRIPILNGSYHLRHSFVLCVMRIVLPMQKKRKPHNPFGEVRPSCASQVVNRLNPGLGFLEDLVECSRRKRSADTRDKVRRLDASDWLVYLLWALRVPLLLAFALTDSCAATHDRNSRPPSCNEVQNDAN